MPARFEHIKERGDNLSISVYSYRLSGKTARGPDTHMGDRRASRRSSKDRMKPLIALLCAAALISGCAKSSPEVAVNPPFTFQTLTQDQNLAAAGPMLSACAAQTPDAQQLCPLKDTLIAGARAQTTGAVFDREGFRELRIDWRPSDYAVVARDLTLAYGIPCSLETRTLKHQYTSIDNVITQWCFSGGAMILEKYSDNFAVTRLTYLSTPRVIDASSPVSQRL